MAAIAVPIPVEFLSNVSGPDYVYTPGGFPGGNSPYYLDAIAEAESTYDAALVTFNAIAAAYETFLAGPYATFNTALSTYLAAFDVSLTAQATWIFAGSPGSGPDYDTHVAADSTYDAALTTWISASSTFEPAPWFSTYASVLSAFGTAWGAFNVNGVTTYLLATDTFEGAAYVYSQAGSPGSGPAFDTYQAALVVESAALNVWETAQTTFNAAIAATLEPYFTAQDTVNAAYDVYEQAYTLYEQQLAWLNTLELAIAFHAANPTLPNPYSTINPLVN